MRRGGAGNHYDIDSGEGLWISGIKKNGTDRHKFGIGGGASLPSSDAKDNPFLTNSTAIADKKRVF